MSGTITKAHVWELYLMCAWEASLYRIDSRNSRYLDRFATAIATVAASGTVIGSYLDKLDGGVAVIVVLIVQLFHGFKGVFPVLGQQSKYDGRYQAFRGLADEIEKLWLMVWRLEQIVVDSSLIDQYWSLKQRHGAVCDQYEELPPVHFKRTETSTFENQLAVCKRKYGENHGQQA